MSCPAGPGRPDHHGWDLLGSLRSADSRPGPRAHTGPGPRASPNGYATEVHGPGLSLVLGDELKIVYKLLLPTASRGIKPPKERQRSGTHPLSHVATFKAMFGAVLKS